jgi:hypothetical protein
MTDSEVCGAAGGMLGMGNCSARRKSSLSAALPTTKLTLLDRGTNSSRRGGNPPTNLLNYGIANQRIVRIVTEIFNRRWVALVTVLYFPSFSVISQYYKFHHTLGVYQYIYMSTFSTFNAPLSGQ